MIEIIPNRHPVFIHFMVALLTIAATIHLLSHCLPNGKLVNQLTIVARWNLWFGVGFILLGWYVYSTVGHDAPSRIIMTEHRNWAMATFALFMGVADWEYCLSRRGKGRGWLFTGLLVIAAGFVAVSRMAWRQTGLPVWLGRAPGLGRRATGTVSPHGQVELQGAHSGTCGSQIAATSCRRPASKKL